MANAKLELLSAVGSIGIKCAIVERSILKLNYSKEDYNAFLESLDFTYDEGYGSQNLYGIVWLEDGTWFTRGEYDGSEWWEHHELPEIPEECL